MPVRIANVGNNLHTLQVLTTRLNHDTKALRQRGIATSSWGPDYASNTVQVTLERYSPGRAAYLVWRSGPNNARKTNFGGAEGTRTPDPLHAMEVRYQLRHSPAARAYRPRATRES